MSVVGYERQRGQLRRLAASVHAGGGGACVLAGPAGVGKSTLLAELTDEVGEVTLVEARGVVPERAVPFSTLHALLAGVGDPTVGLPGPQAQALGVALSLADGPAPDPLTLSVAVHTRLAQLAPLLVVVDDLQWVDASSRALIGFVARRAEPAGIGVVVAHRPDPDVAWVLDGLETRRLAGIGPAAARTLLSDMSGVVVSVPVAARLQAEAAGNPLVLGELARAVPADVLAGHVPLDVGPLPVARGVVPDRYADRVRGLPADTRLAVLVAAACGRDDRVVLDQVLDEMDLDEQAWTPAVSAGLLAVDDRVTFRHPLMRTAAYRVAPDGDRHRVHHVVAKVVEDAERRIWHLVRAADEPDDGLASEAATAGFQAAGRGGRVEAARLFEDATRLCSNPSQAATWRLEAARHWHFGGHPPRAAELLDSLLADATLGPDGWLDAHLLRGHVDLWRGEIPRALANLTAAADEADDPVAAAVLECSASVASIMSGDIPRAVGLAEGAHATLTSVGHPMASLAACALAEAVLLAGHTDRGQALLDELDTEELIERFGVDVGTLTGAFVVAHAFGLAGRWEESRRQLEQLIDLARRAGALAILELPLPNLADLHHRFGNLCTARDLVDEALEIATFTGNLTDRAHALAIQARIAAVAGDPDVCLPAVETILAGAGRHGWHALATYAHHARGHLALGMGRPEEAIADLQVAGRLEAAHGVVDPLVVPFGPDLVEALVRTGRTAEAASALERLVEAVGRTGSRWGAGVLARCRGLLEGDPDQLVESVEVLEGTGANLDVQRSRLCLGEILRRCQQRAAARDQLWTAADELARRGATGWAIQASRELRAAGGRPPPTGRPGRPRHLRAADLTEREQAIAGLVAVGATNREIAAQLYLSPKTIENHLTRIYAKLDVRSRTELASQLHDV